MKPITLDSLPFPIARHMDRLVGERLRGKLLVANTAPAADPLPRLSGESLSANEEPESPRWAFWRRLRAMSAGKLRDAHQDLLRGVQAIPLELQRVERDDSLSQPQYKAARAEILRLQDEAIVLLEDCRREIAHRCQQHELRRQELSGARRQLEPDEVFNLADYPQLAER